MSADTIHAGAQESLRALLHAYLKEEVAIKAQEEIEAIVFDTNKDFLDRYKQLGAWFGSHPQMEDLEDVAFDLLMVQFLAGEPHPENYFESQEWERLEEKTLDKGSEMLTLLLYTSEAIEEDAEISLRDFLDEFLLVGDDGLQDDYRIFESLIVNEGLTEANLESIREVQKTVKVDTGLQPYFVPMILFFQYAEDTLEEDDLEALSPFEMAVLQALIAFAEN